MTISYLPQHPAPALVGLDLSALGAAGPCPVAPQVPAHHADLLRLAAYARGARRAGLSFVTLGPTYRLRADQHEANGLDALIAARRIGSATNGAGLVTSVPPTADPRAIQAELTSFSTKDGGWAGLQVEPRAEGSPHSLLGQLGRGHGGKWPRTVMAVQTENEAHLAGRVADLVRLRETNVTWARELRYAVRAAVQAAGRTNVPVVVDVRTVLSSDPVAARVRAELVEHLSGGEGGWGGALEAIGSAEATADLLNHWLAAGAADGFVAIPGSLPADVKEFVQHVLPHLSEPGQQATAQPPQRVAAGVG